VGTPQGERSSHHTLIVPSSLIQRLAQHFMCCFHNNTDRIALRFSQPLVSDQLVYLAGKQDDDAPAKEGALLMSDNNRFQPDYPDTTVTLVPYFSVPKGKMSEFKSHFGKFYQHTINGTFSNGPCLFYGFAISDDTVFCREGYASAEGVLAHLDEVKEELDAACGLVGPTGLSLSVMGPKAELDALRPALSPLGCKFFVMDAGCSLFQ
jgi:hypothetical protein